MRSDDKRIRRRDEGLEISLILRQEILSICVREQTKKLSSCELSSCFHFYGAGVLNTELDLVLCLHLVFVFCTAAAAASKLNVGRLSCRFWFWLSSLWVICSLCATGLAAVVESIRVFCVLNASMDGSFCVASYHDVSGFL